MEFRTSKLELNHPDLTDGFIAWVRQDHPLPVKGTVKKFWIHCPCCTDMGKECDFGKGDGLTERGALEAAYEHVQRKHPLIQLLTIEMVQTPPHPMKLSTADKRTLR